MKRIFLLFASVIWLVACTTAMPPQSEQLHDQVFNTEKAFAKTLADRDIKTFSNYISNEAVFFSGDKTLQGRDAIVAAWSTFFKTSAAPFSWAPKQVVVLESGKLALSTGPVFDAKGDVIATFNSIWRREESGEWRIVFDKGCDVCVKCPDAH